MAESVSAGFSGGRRFLWKSRTLWIPLGGVAKIVGIAYWRLLPDIAKTNREWGTDSPPTSMGYIPQVFTAFMGVGYAALLSLLLLLAGSWSAVPEKRALLLLWGAITLSPILMSLQGVCPIMGLRPLSNVFSSLALDLNSGGHRLARNTRLDGKGAAV